MPQNTSADPAVLRRWVETWRRAGAALEGIRRAEIESIDTREAVRQIFDAVDPTIPEPGPPTSGLVEQQAWFARVRLARGKS